MNEVSSISGIKSNYFNSPLHVSLPEKVEINEINENECEFVFSDLEKGFGTTIGNAYRRTLISSIVGHAITAIKIPGVKHEFDSITGVVEDMINVVLNLKQVRIRRKEDATENTERVHVSIKDATVITCNDLLKKSSYFEAVNGNFTICNLDKNVNLDFEIMIGSGYGFTIGDQQKNYPLNEGFIAIDSIFSPVKNVKFNIDENSEKETLTLTVTTDGEIPAKKAIEEASSILVSAFALLFNFSINKVIQGENESIFSVNDSIFDMHKLLMTPICNSNVNLSVRACNCLKSANISTLGDLVSKKEEELMELKNFGKKSLKELKALIESKNLKFGMDLSEYKIYKNN